LSYTFEKGNRVFEREVGDPNPPAGIEHEARLYGKAFLSRGYCVSTVGLDEQMIRAYIRNQEELDRQEELFD
jgi:REP element-mobilizing transposase RayT